MPFDPTANGYSDTWKFAGHPRYANEKEWREETEATAKGYDIPVVVSATASAAQINGPTDAWDKHQFEHMKEDEYKTDTPVAYLTSTYTPRPAGMTDAALKAAE